jgi:S1/P1 Nuclease
VVCAGTQFTGCAADEKRIALRFVAHLVGDIHQPLHAGFAEDRGGNSVDVRFNGRKTNLHSLWDTGLVELEEGTPAEIAARIDAAVAPDDRKQWQHGTPEQWALESLAIVRAQVYRLPASGEINATYIERARAVIRTRLAQAGSRLAWMLNQTFQNSTVRPSPLVFDYPKTLWTSPIERR